MDEILDDLDINLELSETEQTQFEFVKGTEHDIPKNFAQQLKALVPTTLPNGKQSYNIYMMKNMDVTPPDALSDKRKFQNDDISGEYQKRQKETLKNSEHIRSTEPSPHSKFEKRIYQLQRANKIASENLYDTGGDTMEQALSFQQL